MAGDPGTRARRHAAIRAILAAEAVGSQAALVARLETQGFQVTQSSVSRDLDDLRVVKVDGRYVAREALAGGGEARDELAEAAGWIRRFRPAGDHLLVVSTPPGRAQAVGLALDHAAWSGVVGTVAGDDTLFVATEGRREQAAVAARLGRLCGGRADG